MNSKIKGRTVIACVVASVLAGGYYSLALADPSSYQKDRQMMSAQGGNASGNTAQSTPVQTAAPVADAPQISTSAPGSNLSQLDPPKQAVSTELNAAHNFTPTNGNSVDASNSQTTTASLLKQAQFWHDKYQLSLARQSLNRVLLTDPENAEALYLMSLWSSEVGDNEQAEQYRRRLEIAHPRDSRLQTLRNEKDLATYSKDQLNKARQLAGSGNIPAALQAYRQMFPNGQVPRSLLNEYYLTMSGDPAHFNEAVQGVGAYIKKNPNDTQAKVTYGKLLTYNDSTRRNGIEVLDYYAKDSQDADKSLRQALLWLTPNDSDEKYYKAFLTRHPYDVEIRNRLATALTDSLNSSAYSQFRQQNTAQAKAQFEQVLKRDPNNLAALEGLGYLNQAKGDYKEAAALLSRASNVTTDQAKQVKLVFDAELNNARALEKAGDVQGALNRTLAVSNMKGGNSIDVTLYRASLERKLKMYQKAEDDLKAVLAVDPQNEGAGEMLYYTLRDQGKTAEARALLATLPITLNRTIAKREAVPADPAVALRQKAKSQERTGDLIGAAATLERATAVSKDPWIRHDLAVIQHKLGNDADARANLMRLLNNGSNASTFAAASLQSELGDTRAALATINTLPASYNARGVASLRSSLAVRSGMADAENYLKSGQKAATLNTLAGLERNTANLSAADLGHMAYLYLQAGNTSKARALADSAYARGINSTATINDYADLVSVYNSLGMYSQAQAITSNPALTANTDPSKLSAISNGQVIREADKLRQAGRSADAYDLLFNALQSSPQDPSLMAAMARIYHDNGMYNEAETIYDRVLLLDPTDEGAITGAINTAIANNHEQRAMELAQRLNNSDPQTLYLKARVAKENHNYREAITYLRQSKSILEGSPYISDPLATGAAVSPNGAAGSVHAVNNPFRNKNEYTARNQSNTPGMPWEVTSSTAKVDPASMYMFDTGEIDRRKTLGEVNNMLHDLYEITSTSVSLDVEGRQKDGEEGLSNLSEIRGSVRLSTPVFNDNRLTATVTAGSMKAGTSKTASQRKLGTQALAMGAQTMANRLNALNDAAKSAVQMDSASTTTDEEGNVVNSHTNAKNLAKQIYGSEDQYQKIIDLSGRGHLTAQEMASINLTSATWIQGIQNLLNSFGLDGSNSDQMNALIYNYTDNTYGGGGYNKSVHDNGLEFNLALSGEHYRADIGSSPLGKDGSTFVGGIYVHPEIAKDTELRINLERRAVADSVLSYYGVKDDYSGTFFGAVTKNGGSLGLAWDNGSYGAYANASYYYYKGENVRNNHMYGLQTGVYVRPINNSIQTLQAGLSLEYMNYAHNENLFTAGHGGYFSPKDYYSISIPVDWKRVYNENLELSLGASLGYQSYTNQAEDYFPTRASWQATLNTLASNGLAQNSRFAAEDKDGVSGSVRLGLDYQVTDAFSVKANINYSTFGDYKETNEMLTFKYLTGIDSFF